MIGSVGAALERAGVNTVLSERFLVEGAAAPAPRAPKVAGAAAFATAVIVADGVRTVVPVDEGETVLTAALRAGLDLPFSCRGENVQHVPGARDGGGGADGGQLWARGHGRWRRGSC